MFPHRGKDKAKKRNHDALPVLDPRVRPLTPTPSNEELSLASIEATSQSAFFQKLPSEIRTRILIMAFGGRTVHMDLSEDHPDVELRKKHKSSGGPHVHGHKRVYTAGRPGYNYLFRNIKVPKQWIWQGSVCHRNAPEPYKSIMPELEPSEDFCRHGGLGDTEVGDICELWHAKDGEVSCNIGAMGWLLSCRQAYNEGIEVLYSTNTIHSASKFMLLNLDKLLLPQRLSSIKSLELIWTFDPYLGDCAPIKEPCRDFTSFEKFLDVLPVFFPRVQRLHVAIQGEIYPGERMESGGWGFMRNTSKAIRIVEKDILTPFDEMVNRLGPSVREVTLACSSYLYGRARAVALENNDTIVQQVHLGAEKERYYRAFPRGRGRNNHLGGYWVQLGQRDAKPAHVTRPQPYGMLRILEPEPVIPEEDKVLSSPSSLWYAYMRR